MTDVEFCDKLKQLARQYGWSGDYTEVIDFVMWAHKQLNIPINLTEISPPDE